MGGGASHTVKLMPPCFLPIKGWSGIKAAHATEKLIHTAFPTTAMQMTHNSHTLQLYFARFENKVKEEITHHPSILRTLWCQWLGRLGTWVWPWRTILPSLPTCYGCSNTIQVTSSGLPWCEKDQMCPLMAVIKCKYQDGWVIKELDLRVNGNLPLCIWTLLQQWLYFVL